MNKMIEEIRKRGKEGDYIISWYTKETYVYGMINRAIRKRNVFDMF